MSVSIPVLRRRVFDLIQNKRTFLHSATFQALLGKFNKLSVGNQKKKLLAFERTLRDYTETANTKAKVDERRKIKASAARRELNSQIQNNLRTVEVIFRIWTTERPLDVNEQIMFDNHAYYPASRVNYQLNKTVASGAVNRTMVEFQRWFPYRYTPVVQLMRADNDHFREFLRTCDNGDDLYDVFEYLLSADYIAETVEMRTSMRADIPIDYNTNLNFDNVGACSYIAFHDYIETDDVPLDHRNQLWNKKGDYTELPRSCWAN